MAIQLEFINLVIPITVIDAKYPGGWVQCLEDHHEALWDRIWYDDHLFRDGSMNKKGLASLLNSWASIGLVLTEEADGRTYWKDLCVCEQDFGSHYPCPWIAFDGLTAHHHGSNPGVVIGRGGIVKDD
jgi:hypothetical protein